MKTYEEDFFFLDSLGEKLPSTAGLLLACKQTYSEAIDFDCKHTMLLFQYSLSFVNVRTSKY